MAQLLFQPLHLRADGGLRQPDPVMFLEYWNRPDAMESSFTNDGWFRTGDVAVLQGDLLHIVDRVKDLIIRGGHNIHPARIENLALKHPAILKAAAFAVADKRLGEKVCLAVILREGATVEPGVLLDHLFEVGLSKFDMPEFFIAMDAFPLTASGKILKRELVEWVRAGRIAPAPCRWVDPKKRA